MEIIKEFSINELVYDNTISSVNSISIDLINGDTICINYDAIIDTQFSGGNIDEEYENLKLFLGLGIYSKSPDGGFVNFYRLNGTNGGVYIIYSGVNEVSNSHYIITSHKVIKV